MFIKNLVKKFIYRRKKRTVVAAFNGEAGDSVSYSVVDYTYPFFHRLNRRCIEFHNQGSYIYSSIYFSEKRIFQPIYPTMQKMIDLYYTSPPDNALVLGCAGCSVPRFLTLRYKNCKTTGIEYSSQVIEIAKEYFFTEEMHKRVDVIHDDAFEYIKNPECRDKYDLVFIDVFIANKLHPMVFDEGFIQNVYDSLTNNGAAMINAFGLPGYKAYEYILALKPPFQASYVIRQNARYYILMVKNKSEKELYEFEEMIEKCASVYKRIIK